MKIIKSNLFRHRQCKYGNFELQTDKNWSISYSFIDFESGLLIVSTNDDNENHWENLGYNGKRIPSKQYVIDLNNLKILSAKEWSKFFNYESKISYSSDNKLKLTTQRIHHPEDNIDTIQEKLEIIESGHISTSESFAFSDQKRENLLQQTIRRIEENQEKKRQLESKLTLDEFYSKELNSLNEKDIIFNYINNDSCYQLSFIANEFILSKSKLKTEKIEYEQLEFKFYKDFKNIEDFWDYFSKNNKWFIDYSTFFLSNNKPHLLAKFIIPFFNQLRKNHLFTFEEYNKINQWQNIIWNDEYKATENKQWCSLCKKEVDYSPRYPKYICNECSLKDKFDINGNLVEFSNLGISGGLKITRYKNQIIEEDDSQFMCDCTIENKLFFVHEARFGGIVIQLKS
ncbi:hypothetical protein [Chishuiella sp.]|uniref:hypothetical protein n=1 Tax=Chishuiella sp. TaxID=1969467 RepID=UPI0028A7E830|nr:hypothetical protein [Chishuiella sp.]